MITKNVLWNLLCTISIVALGNICHADEFVKVKDQASDASVNDNTKWVTPKENSAPTEIKAVEITEAAPKNEAPAVEAPVPPAPTTPPATSAPAQPAPAPIAVSKPAPAGPLRGEIKNVNLKKNFVVVEFNKTKIPSAGSKLGVYRSDTFVGSIQLTQPIKPPYASADIVSGTIRSGDIVR